MSFKYELNERVKLSEGSESGVIVGRAEFTATENNYLIRYVAGDNRMVEQWWNESAVIDNE